MGNGTKRGRFANVVHADDLPWESWSDPANRFGVESREAAVALGAQQLGFSIASLAPGKRSCPFHFHHAEEELFYVLEGRGFVRQGDASGEEEIELRPGDFVSFPAGTGVAHQFLNRGDAPFVYLAVSNRVTSDIAEYPDSDKVLIRSTGMILRRGPKLEYFDGEA